MRVRQCRPQVPKALLLSPALIGSFFLCPRFSFTLENEPREGGPIQRHTKKASYQWGYSYNLKSYQLISIFFQIKTC
jgi:hypothetical protein